MATNTILDSNETKISVGYDFENSMTDLFDKNFLILDTKELKFTSLSLKFKIVGYQEPWMSQYFNSEELDKISQEGQDNNISYIVCYDPKYFPNCIIRKTEVSRIVTSFIDAYKNGFYISNCDIDLYNSIADEYIKKYFKESIPVKHLLNKSNTIFFKEDLPIFVTNKCENHSKYVYDLTEKSDASEPKIILNFNSKNYFSNYEKPANTIFEIDEEEPILGAKSMHLQKFKIIVAQEDVNNVYIFSLETDGLSFKIVSVEEDYDYRNTKNVLTSKLGLEDKLKELVKYNLDTHMENLLDFID